MTIFRRGLYAITDSHLIADDRLVATVAQAILGGARMIQFRDKSTAKWRRLNQATALRKLCDHHRIPLIINDDVELAAVIGAAGVHLGQDDTPLADARGLLGEHALIGVSCHHRLDLAVAAAGAGASYVAFGSFFPSVTKPDAVRADIDLLRQARQILGDIPIVAIGGITIDNARALVDAGADGLAVISGVFGQSNVRHAVRAFAELYA